MLVKDLISRLSTYPGILQVMIGDSFNGGGNPREINAGPVLHLVTEGDSEATADCEGLEGEYVVKIGFGSY